MGDLILIGVMHAIHELKQKVPDDIGVIGISNGFIPTMYDPKITYVETSGYKLGKLAFTQMLTCLKEGPTSDEVFLESLLGRRRLAIMFINRHREYFLHRKRYSFNTLYDYTFISSVFYYQTVA